MQKNARKSFLSNYIELAFPSSPFFLKKRTTTSSPPSISSMGAMQEHFQALEGSEMIVKN